MLNSKYYWRYFLLFLCSLMQENVLVQLYIKLAIGTLPIASA